MSAQTTREFTVEDLPEMRVSFFKNKETRNTVVVGTTHEGMSAMSNTLQDYYAKAGGMVRVMDKGPSAER
jgi:hypothetical protein